jgi:hypothetical protein
VIVAVVDTVVSAVGQVIKRIAGRGGGGSSG